MKSKRNRIQEPKGTREKEPNRIPKNEERESASMAVYVRVRMRVRLLCFRFEAAMTDDILR